MSANTASFLSGGGEMGRLCRAYDWAASPLGPVEVWPQSLRSAVSILLPSKAQIILFWGPQFVCIYNDAYRPIFGTRHPRALGKAGAVAWDVIWPVLGPLLEGVVKTGEAFSAPDFAYFVDRAGFLEEVYFDVSYDPVRDESGGVGAVFCIVSETTLRVLGERRLETLRDLGAEAATVRQSIEEACRSCIPALEANPRDVPFAIVYLADGDSWSIGAVTGEPRPLLEAAGLLEPAAWPLSEVSQSRTPRVVADLQLPLLQLEGLPPGRTPTQAVALPLRTSDLGRSQGVLVVGVSAVLELDDAYQAFFGLIARHVATAIANATAYLEEKRRAEALAQIDRAKTAFFSNVSHEFRTPLTLMLGPLEDLLAPARQLTPGDRALAVVAHRNALRLYKLVNTLLDFSRIEAGRAQASFEPTDLAAFTAGLASSFRSAVEKAGMRLVVNCSPLPSPVFVDREMWEKIVLNLLSNAFKFTFDGEIRVDLRSAGDRAELTITDTGVGIPEDALPHLFERFYRVENSEGRTHEGSGIGLALVQELAALHGGTVRAASTIRQGSTFAVSIPFGSNHLPKDRIAGARTVASTALGAASFVEEALRWLPDSIDADDPPPAPPGDVVEGAPVPAELKGALVVLADDNADMRAYVERLLLARGFRVVTVGDGLAALAAIRRELPDLVLTDVMMPKLDGFGVVKALRADPRLRTLPVVMLSARAGQESTVEGLDAGADDYIVKPFSARELCARVEGAIQLSRVRRASEAALVALERTGREHAEQANKIKDEFLATLSHELRTPLNAILGWSQLLRKALTDPARMAEGLAVIERNARAQSQLIADLLDMSRIVSGKISLEIGDVELSRLVSAAIQSIQPAADAKGVMVDARIDAGVDIIQADGPRVQQMIWNLATNAVKFTPAGGRVMVAVSQVGTHVEVSVSDTGVGIAPEFLPYVFDRFRQADASTTRSQSGLGLGLSIVKQLAELHGGSIDVASPGPGQGATFRLKLPIQQVQASLHRMQSSDDSPVARPR